MEKIDLIFYNRIKTVWNEFVLGKISINDKIDYYGAKHDFVLGQLVRAKTTKELNRLLRKKENAEFEYIRLKTYQVTH